MRIALTLGFSLGLAQAALLAPSWAQGPQDSVGLPAGTVPVIAPVQPANPLQAVVTPQAAPSVKPQSLGSGDVVLYRQIFAAERNGEIAKAQKLLGKISDPSLEAYAQAVGLLSARHVTVAQLIEWLQGHRDLAIADRVYRLAVSHSSKRVRKHHKTITVAVVTNIPAPLAVPRRTGGFEDQELPEPSPGGEVGRAALGKILADIRAGQPDAARAHLQSIQNAGCTPEDIAILSHRIAASYLAEGMDLQAFQLASSPSSTSAAPQLDWDAGFAAYRLGRWEDAAQHLEKLAQDASVQGTLRAQAAFWAARAHMQAGQADRVVSLLAAAAKEEPTFYGLIAERMLGMDTHTGFSDPVLSAADFSTLMSVPAARRAVALWQVGETEDVGTELNRAFVANNEALDPAMAALARALGVTNIELRASEASVGRGLLLTGLFPVPPYQPEGGYHIDNSLVLAFARIESRFQNGSTSVAGAHGIMQLMPATAKTLAGPRAVAQLDNPAYSLSLGQRYISELLDHLNGNLLELGGAYNAGPGAASRWLQTKAGKDDPLLFVESIPIAETRSYVRRLMEYQWMYRRRFGQDARSLDQLARGEWPIYRPALAPVPAPATPIQASTPGSGDATTF